MKRNRRRSSGFARTTAAERLRWIQRLDESELSLTEFTLIDKGDADFAPYADLKRTIRIRCRYGKIVVLEKGGKESRMSLRKIPGLSRDELMLLVRNRRKSPRLRFAAALAGLGRKEIEEED